jgi:dTDP-4-amino-4,6-dideoxygalactose transaminase
MKKMFIPFSVPFIGKEEIDSVVDTLRSGWLTTGPKTKQFEADFASYIGVKHAIAVNSCTAALHLAMDAVGVGKGDIVLTTPMTFAATAEVIEYMGATPKFVDIDPGTLNMSPALLERTLASMPEEERRRVKAVVPVHMAGQPCDMDPITETARKYGLKVVEDAAHTMPAKYKGRMVGTMSGITCFSFYPTKCITTGEGGMVTTDDDEYADRMRVMSLHGISRGAWNRYSKEGSWYYEVLEPGFKYNMPDVLSAIGIGQLKRSEELLELRMRHAEIYNQAFKDMPGIELPEISPDVEHSWHLYIIKLNLEMLCIDRGQFIEELRARGVFASVHFIPLHIHPYYREKYGYEPSDFPRALREYHRMLSLPFYPKMSDEELDYVIDAVREVLERSYVKQIAETGSGLAA